DNDSASLADRLQEKYLLLFPLIGHLGGVAPALFLLGLAALRVPGRWIAVASGLVAAVYVMIGCASLPVGAGTSEFALVGALGVFGAIVGMLVFLRLVIPLKYVPVLGFPEPSSPVPWLLAGWLLLEFLGYFPLTPFPAVRRVFGVMLVGSLLVGHL